MTNGPASHEKKTTSFVTWFMIQILLLPFDLRAINFLFSFDLKFHFLSKLFFLIIFTTI
jgi:hypothetical protein